MFEKYYVSIYPQTNGYHPVHKENCPFLPEAGKRIFLGKFMNPRDALEESKKYFSRSNICLFCSKEYEDKKKKPDESFIQLADNFVSFDRLSVTWESAFLCSVN